MSHNPIDPNHQLIHPLPGSRDIPYVAPGVNLQVFGQLGFGRSPKVDSKALKARALRFFRGFSLEDGIPGRL